MSEGSEQAPKTALLPALRSSLAEARGEKRDAGAEALALRYAELLDECAVEKQYVKALELVSMAVDRYADDLPLTASDQMRAAFTKISTALAEHTTASDLGPKLLAAMTALNLTPAARSEKGKGGQVATPAAPVQTAAESPLEKARRIAAERRGGVA